MQTFISSFSGLYFLNSQFYWIEITKLESHLNGHILSKNKLTFLLGILYFFTLNL